MRQFFVLCGGFFTLFLVVPAVLGYAQAGNDEEIANQIEIAAIHNLNPSEMAVYHSGLPVNTMVRVTNPENNKDAVVRVLGRVSGSPSRLIHITEEVANLLEISGTGFTPVRVELENNLAVSVFGGNLLEDFSDEPDSPVTGLAGADETDTDENAGDTVEPVMATVSLAVMEWRPRSRRVVLTWNTMPGFKTL